MHSKEAGVGTFMKGVSKPVSKWATNSVAPMLKRNLAGLFARNAKSSKSLSKYVANKGSRYPEAGQSFRQAMRGFAKRPLGTVKHGWDRMGTGEKAFFTGMTALEAPGAITDKKNRGKRLAGLAGGTVLPWMTLRRLPLLSQAVAWEGMHRGSSALGGLADKASKV